MLRSIFALISCAGVASAAACANSTNRAAATQVAASETSSVPTTHNGAFVVKLGDDTIVVEKFSRSGATYSVEQVLRSPTVRLFHTHVALKPSGDLAEMSYMQHTIGPNLGPVLATTDIKVTGDSATLLGKRGDSTVVNRRIVAPAGSLPTLPSSYFGYELASVRLVASGKDSMQARFIGPNGPAGLTVRRVGPDSVFFVLDPATTYRAHVDRQGRILHMNAPFTTFRIQLTRVDNVNVSQLAAGWSAAPAMGVLSPADSVITKVGDATVAIRYSRPSKRGRVVFGDSAVAMEPWGKVWRTGANEATRFETDRDLTIGDKRIPAGKYTLWTQLDRGGWQLIVNRQLLRPDNSGRLLWGTMYDRQYDVARVPMTMTTLTSPVEHMTIALEPDGDGATLRISWDLTQATVPVRVAR